MAKEPTFKYNGEFFGMRLDKEQINFIEQIWKPSNIIVFCNAEAGTGKTTLAVGMAEVLYKKGLYRNGIIYLAAPYGMEKQGFLKGSLEEKSAPYYEPMYEALIELGINPDKVVKRDEMVTNRKYDEPYVECRPNTFLRGLNMSESIVIIDEAQNNTKRDLKTILTRCHDDCKVIVIGHTGQQDIVGQSGFKPYMDWISEEPYCAVCSLTTNYRGLLSKKADALK